jgi:hypothetical protein
VTPLTPDDLEGVTDSEIEALQALEAARRAVVQETARNRPTAVGKDSRNSVSLTAPLDIDALRAYADGLEQKLGGNAGLVGTLRDAADEIERLRQML